MFRVIFLILILMSSVAFAQKIESKPGEKPKPVKIAEFGKLKRSELKERIDEFTAKLQSDPSATGYIINYGLDFEVQEQERKIRDNFRIRRYDSSRVVFIQGGQQKVLKTEFWIVPAGADPPFGSKNEKTDSPPEAVKLDDFGKVSDRYFDYTIRDFSARLDQDKSSKGVIINYIGKQENQENSYSSMAAKLNDHPVLRELILENRITFIEGGTQDNQRTQLWIVPEGAKLPTP